MNRAISPWLPHRRSLARLRLPNQRHMPLQLLVSAPWLCIFAMRGVRDGSFLMAPLFRTRWPRHPIGPPYVSARSCKTLSHAARGRCQTANGQLIFSQKTMETSMGQPARVRTDWATSAKVSAILGQNCRNLELGSIRARSAPSVHTPCADWLSNLNPKVRPFSARIAETWC